MWRVREVGAGEVGSVTGRLVSSAASDEVKVMERHPRREVQVFGNVELQMRRQFKANTDLRVT